jgi:Flp pilus assembly protein CpaB
MQRRSTTIVMIGLLTLVLGAATTFAALHGSKKASADSGKSQVQAAAPPTGQPTGFTIPDGKQALAVALDPVAGTAGTATMGSHIDVYAAVTQKTLDAKGNPAEVHAARLVLQDVEVLSMPGAPMLPAAGKAVAAAQAPSSTSTYILAVTPAEAEMLVFHTSFSKLYFSVLPVGAKPVAPTQGVDQASQLNPVAAG